MAARKIPITSNTQQRTTAAPQPTAWASSLDLVFSFSRSAAFFGENLPSGPSFVDSAKFRRPGSTGNDNDSSIAPSDDRGDESGLATSDDEEAGWSGGEDMDDHDWDNNQQPDARREQLPSNAIVNTRKSPRRSRAQRDRSHSTSDSPGSPSRLSRSAPSQSSHSMLSPPSHSPPSERTPLVSTQRLSPTSGPSRDGTGRYKSARGQGHRSSSPQMRQISGKHRTSSRRLSIVSAELWKEAIEENRGKSTWGQTLFNTVNVLIGVGLLAEPLAFADAGWVLGTLLLAFCALITNYTAKILAKVMATDPTLQTYADVLVNAYGQRAKTFIYAMFVLELGALSIALVVLFADSMESLFPAISTNVFKLMFFVIILPTTFVPLRFLSITSLIGIISTLTLLAVLIADGTLKTHAPGSLSDPMYTAAGPRWMRLPLSFGLMMSGFSGHAVVPSLYRDMENPRQFPSMINAAYVIAFSVSMLFGALGYVMFGLDVSSELTSDLIKTPGNPVVLNKIAVWMVALNPVVKYAIANAPLVQTFEIMIGLQPVNPQRPSPNPLVLNGSAIASEGSSSSVSESQLHLNHSDSHVSDARLRASSDYDDTRQPFFKRYTLWITRPLLTATAVVLAIVIPDFARVLSFLGSASAFIICCIGPIGAYLILGGKRYRHQASHFRGGGGGGGGGYKSIPGQRTREFAAAANGGGPSVMFGRTGAYDPDDGDVQQVARLEGWERVMCWVLLVLSIMMAVVGTVWAFLPLD